MLNKEIFIQQCRVLGADIVGVSPIERFSDVQPEGDPRYILPRVKSVIVIAHSIPRGWTRGIESHSDWETVYRRGGYIESPITIEIAYNICTYLEDNGFDAVPLYQYPLEMRSHGVSVKKGNPKPDVVVDTYYAAHAAGLGQIGRCGFFLTRQFGPRQQFTTILTNADFEADPITEIDFCNNCINCIEHCPTNAISENEHGFVTQCDGKKQINKISLEFCRQCNFGARPNSFMPNAAPERILAACGRACIAYLEDNNLLEYKFANKYRR